MSSRFSAAPQISTSTRCPGPSSGFPRTETRFGGSGLRWLAVAACALAPACGDGTPDHLEEGQSPIVLIVLDALGAKHVQHLGYERDTTPNIDQLAAEGVTFVNSFAPAPYTVASIPSLLTGRLPDTHRVVVAKSALASEEVTLAEHLKSLGYQTYGAVANPNGAAGRGMAQGFDEYFEMFRSKRTRDRAGLNHKNSKFRADDVEDFHLPLGHEFVEALDGWIADRDGGRPPFFYLHFLQPHSPYQSPEPYHSRYLDPAYDGPYLSGETEPLVEAGRDETKMTEADKAATLALYDGNIAYVDSVLADVFQRLRDAGLYDDALIIVTSDHGEAFWEHGMWGHNYHLFDEAVAIPLVAKLPARLGVKGVRAEAMASLIDVVPSLCDWLDLPLPDVTLEGRSLASAVENAQGPGDRQLLMRTNSSKPDLALRSADAKRILRGAAAREAGDVRVYDLEQDPLERNPRPSREEDEEFIETLRRYAIRVLLLASEDGGQELGERERRLLKKLGYTE